MSDQKDESRYEWLEKVSRIAEHLQRPSPSEVRDLDGLRFHSYRQIDRDGREYMTWVLAAPSGWGTGVEFGRWKA